MITLLACSCVPRVFDQKAFDVYSGAEFPILLAGFTTLHSAYVAFWWHYEHQVDLGAPFKPKEPHRRWNVYIPFWRLTRNGHLPVDKFKTVEVPSADHCQKGVPAKMLGSDPSTLTLTKLGY